MELLAELEAALCERRRVIADHDWRERDAAGHLTALQAVSEKIDALAARLGGAAPPRLRHFLENCSYDKALEWLSGASPAAGRCGTT
ncbi:MAG: hypothetical protein ACKV19_01570 [Verrucomicrobiales bacterium]